jgi:nucleoside-diphosphate-sugar epimerase
LDFWRCRFGQALVQSGTSVVADKAMGEPSDRIFHEDTPILPEPERVARVAIDRMVLDASGIRSVALCNSMIYGNTPGVPAQSVQVLALAQQAKASGIARYIGRGLNGWSNVHIADVASLYSLAIARAPAGSLNGEETLGEIVQAIAKRLDLGAAQPWPRSWPSRLGQGEGDVLTRLEQPGARQARNRAELETEASIDHGVDRARNGVRGLLSVRKAPARPR